MPRSTGTTTVFRNRPNLLPPRISDEERRARYRRDVLRLPGRLDRWLIRGLAGAFSKDQEPCALLCTQVQRVAGLCTDGIFVDPDVYILYATIVPANHISSPRAILAYYRGHSTDLSAPDWTNWQTSPPKEIPVCVRHLTVIANMFFGLALKMPNLAQPGLSIRIINWTRQAFHDFPVGEEAEGRMERRALRSAFPHVLESHEITTELIRGFEDM